jgi:hypothetical protein
MSDHTTPRPGVPAADTLDSLAGDTESTFR